MKKRGKPSENDRTTKPVVAFTRKLPAPPKNLSEPEGEIWRAVVASPAGEFIGPEAFPVLAEYCQQVVNARLIGAEVRRFDPKWAEDEDGLKRWDKLLSMQDRAVARASNLAVKLKRLLPSTRTHGRTAAVNAERHIGTPPWEYEG
jgi:hypothetical protein